MIHDHFAEVMGKDSPRVCDFNWDELDLEVHNLDSLAKAISMEEVREDINLMPGDKAPRPDGFTGLFFK